MRPKPQQRMEVTSFRTIDITIVSGKAPWWKYVWGADIWINNVPILKTLVGCNILVWLLMYWSLK